MVERSRSPWYVAHVATTLAAALSGAFLAGFPSAWMLGLTGSLLLAAGVTALIGRRSLLRTRAADIMVATRSDPAAVQRADSLVLGIIFMVLGAAALTAAVSLLLQ